MLGDYLGFRSSFLRPKRKLSGPVIDRNPSMRLQVAISPEKFSLPSSTTTSKFHQRICKYIDIWEVLGFILAVFGMVITVTSCVLVWVLFFQFVVRPEDPTERAQYAGLWALIALFVFYLRHVFRRSYDQYILPVADHAEIFVAVSLAMVFSTNTAFYLHIPAPQPLPDVGFLLIPELDLDSIGRAASDIMTVALPIICGLQSALMTRQNRSIAFCAFFRIATICYGLRSMTVALTSLPGPAPHCRPGSVNYNPPEHWLDVVTRVGPMHGKFNTCGDLLFSGHMCYTNSALLLYLRLLDRNFKRHSLLRWILGMMYLGIVAILTIAGRKHYTVDVILGIMISTLVFFHFEHSWIPLCFRVNFEEYSAYQFESQATSLPQYKNSKDFSDSDMSTNGYIMNAFPSTSSISPPLYARNKAPLYEQDLPFSLEESNRSSCSSSSSSCSSPSRTDDGSHHEIDEEEPFLCSSMPISSRKIEQQQEFVC